MLSNIPHLPTPSPPLGISQILSEQPVLSAVSWAPCPLHTHCCHPSRAKYDEVLRWWGLVLSSDSEPSCEVAWQLPFPGIFFELGLSAKCAVFKEMAERFCSGPVAGNEDIWGDILSALQIVSKSRNRGKKKSSLASHPSHWLSPWAHTH